MSKCFCHFNGYEVKDAAAREGLDLANARLGNMVANSGEQTEGNLELIDIRTGADGTVYQTAGDSVRVQITDLKSDLSYNIECLVKDSIPLTYDYKFITGEGEITDDTAYMSCNEYIPLTPENALHILKPTNDVLVRIVEFNSDKTFSKVYKTWDSADSVVYCDELKYYRICYMIENFTRGITLDDIKNIYVSYSDTAYVEDFGAIGDGVTDDTKAIQRALNIRSNISFKYGATYKVTNTLIVDTDIVNSINGNGATLLFDSDKSLFNIVGHMEVASASPQSVGEDNINNGHICIENIKLRSYSFRTGNAITLSKTIFATITNCHITNFNIGILISGINRNMIISNNHIYSNNYGIIFDNTANVHQCNISGNHIGYGIRNIWYDNATVYNSQICSNDLEIADDYDSDDITKYCILVSASQTEKVGEIEIVGNTLQGHGTITNKNIIRLNYVQDGTVSGNHISNGYEANLYLWGCKGLTVFGNEFKGCYSTANIPIVADNGCDYITINGNAMRYCGYVANLVNIRNSVFANNTAELVNGYERPFIIDSTSEVGSKNMIVTGNVINSVTEVTDNYFIKSNGGIVANNISINGALKISTSASDVTNTNNYVA